MLSTTVPSVSIRADLCKRDGLCVKLCPVRAFVASDGNPPTVGSLEECCLCGQCVAGCPSGAIVHSVFTPDRMQRITTREPASVDVAEAFLAQRRSVRNYRKDPPAAIFAHAPTTSSLPQIDCDAAMLYVILAAEAHGLGTCWNGLLQDAAAGAHLRGYDRLSALLHLPHGHRCYAAATIGYPAVKLHSVPHRDVAITWVAQ